MLTLTIHTDTLDNVRVRLALALRQLAVLIEKSPAAEGDVRNEDGQVIGAWMLISTDDPAAVSLQLQGQADAARALQPKHSD